MNKFFRSVGFGIAGHLHVIRTEANMRWHWVATVAVTACGLAFQINPTEWALVVGCIGVMLALECINTSIERLADRIASQPDPLIGQAKDAAAGAVLAMSVASAIIGAIIFVPRMWSLIG